MICDQDHCFEPWKLSRRQKDPPGGPSKLAAVLAFRFRGPEVMIEDLVQLENSG